MRKLKKFLKDKKEVSEDKLKGEFLFRLRINLQHEIQEKLGGIEKGEFFHHFDRNLGFYAQIVSGDHMYQEEFNEVEKAGAKFVSQSLINLVQLVEDECLEEIHVTDLTEDELKFTIREMATELGFMNFEPEESEKEEIKEKAKFDSDMPKKGVAEPSFNGENDERECFSFGFGDLLATAFLHHNLNLSDSLPRLSSVIGRCPCEGKRCCLLYAVYPKYETSTFVAHAFPVSEFGVITCAHSFKIPPKEQVKYYAFFLRPNSERVDMSIEDLENSEEAFEITDIEFLKSYRGNITYETPFETMVKNDLVFAKFSDADIKRNTRKYIESIAVPYMTSKEDEEKVLHHGFVGYLKKPSGDNMFDVGSDFESFYNTLRHFPILLYEMICQDGSKELSEHKEDEELLVLARALYNLLYICGTRKIEPKKLLKYYDDFLPLSFEVIESNGGDRIFMDYIKKRYPSILDHLFPKGVFKYCGYKGGRSPKDDVMFRTNYQKTHLVTLQGCSGGNVLPMIKDCDGKCEHYSLGATATSGIKGITNYYIPWFTEDNMKLYKYVHRKYGVAKEALRLMNFRKKLECLERVERILESISDVGDGDIATFNLKMKRLL